MQTNPVKYQFINFDKQNISVLVAVISFHVATICSKAGMQINASARD